MKQFRDTVYLVSECGNIFNSRTGRQLKPTYCKSGYIIMNLGSKMKVIIHRVVAEVYLSNEDLTLDVNHKDGNKHNNHFSNLEWVTHTFNMKHARETGLISPIKGDNNPMSRLTEEQVINIRYLYKTGDYSCKRLSELYNLTYSGIYAIIKNKTWTHVN